MKILLLCNKNPFPPKDGSSLAIYSMAMGLAEKGADVTVLTMNTKKHYKDPKNLPEEAKKLLKVRWVPINTDVTTTGIIANLIKKESYHVSRFNQEIFENELIKVLKKETFDIIQIEGVFLSDYVNVIKEYSKAKIILRAHNVEHQIWNRYIEHSQSGVKKAYLKLQNSRLRQFEVNSLQNYNALIAITQVDANFLKTLAPNKKTLTIPFGINPDDYPALSIESRDLFHLGAGDWMPNQEGMKWFLNEVWPLVIEKNPKAKFYLGGRNWPIDIQTKNIQGFEFVGEVEDTKQFMENHGTVVVPLHSGSGMRIKIAESMAFGKPIITTSVGVEGIDAPRNEAIWIADTAKEFAEKCLLALDENTDLITLGKASRNWVVTSLERSTLADELLSFYSDIIKG